MENYNQLADKCPVKKEVLRRIIKNFLGVKYKKMRHKCRKACDKKFSNPAISFFQKTFI